MAYFNNIFVERNKVPLDAQLNGLVASSPVGEYIKSEVFISYLKERVSLYQLYLNDFISSVYRTTRNSEFKVVTCTMICHSILL